MRINNKNAVTHGLSRTRINRLYRKMKERCFSEKSSQFCDYGAKGIKICDEWIGQKGFINFYNWAMSNGYNDKLIIDMIDKNKGYCPVNCVWVTNTIKNIKKGIQKNNTSGYKGVSYHKTIKKFLSFVKYKGKMNNLGYFSDIESAVIARNNFIKNNNLPHKIQEV